MDGEVVSRRSIRGRDEPSPDGPRGDDVPIGRDGDGRLEDDALACVDDAPGRPEAVPTDELNVVVAEMSVETASGDLDGRRRGETDRESDGLVVHVMGLVDLHDDGDGRRQRGEDAPGMVDDWIVVRRGLLVVMCDRAHDVVMVSDDLHEES